MLPVVLFVFTDNTGLQDEPITIETNLARGRVADIVRGRLVDELVRILNRLLGLQVVIFKDDIRAGSGAWGYGNRPAPAVPVQLDAWVLLEPDDKGIITGQFDWLRLQLAGALVDAIHTVDEETWELAGISAVRSTVWYGDTERRIRRCEHTIAMRTDGLVVGADGAGWQPPLNKSLDVPPWPSEPPR